MYEVKAYHCSYCKKYGLSKAWIKKHEQKCFLNPETRSCATCENYKIEPVDDPDEAFELEKPLCLQKIDLTGPNGKWALNTNCPLWKEVDDEFLTSYHRLIHN